MGVEHVMEAVTTLCHASLVTTERSVFNDIILAKPRISKVGHIDSSYTEFTGMMRGVLVIL